MSVTTYLMGGCGNAMFQYAAGLALAEHVGTDLHVDDSRYDHDHEPYRCSVTKHYCAQGYRRAFDVQWMAAHYRYNVLGR